MDTKYKVRVALKKLARPFQSAVHALRTYRELRYLKHMKHENVSKTLVISDKYMLLKVSIFMAGCLC